MKNKEFFRVLNVDFFTGVGVKKLSMKEIYPRFDGGISLTRSSSHFPDNNTHIYPAHWMSGHNMLSRPEHIW